MSSPDHDTPTTDDVMVPTENVSPDRREHAKDPHPSQENLDARTQHERELVDSDDA
ncbi:hypothetical protein TEK04_03780 [Klenkia sp. LSe6-5]|uniref:Uncharacterized protein n=1 Tax=Klenkia sesuvii TaxID=3103137 RepID=A0ABU8DPS1_9ACTN